MSTRMVGRWFRENDNYYETEYGGVTFIWRPDIVIDAVTWLLPGRRGGGRAARRVENKYGFLRMSLPWHAGARLAPAYQIKPRSAAELQRLANARFTAWTGRELPRNFFAGLPGVPRQNPLDPAYQGISRHLRARVEQAHAQWELLDAQTDKLYEQGRLDEAAEVEAEAAVALERLDAMLDEVEETEDPTAEDSDALPRTGHLGGAGSELPGEVAEDVGSPEHGLRALIESILREAPGPRFAGDESFLEVYGFGQPIRQRLQKDMTRARAEREGHPLVAPADIPKWQWDGTYERRARGFPTEPGDPRGTGSRAIVTVWVTEEVATSKVFPNFLEAFKARASVMVRGDRKAYDRASAASIWEAAVGAWFDHLRRRHPYVAQARRLDDLRAAVRSFGGGSDALAPINDRLRLLPVRL